MVDTASAGNSIVCLLVIRELTPNLEPFASEASPLVCLQTPCFAVLSGLEALGSAELEALALRTRVWRPFLGQICLKPAF